MRLWYVLDTNHVMLMSAEVVIPFEAFSAADTLESAMLSNMLPHAFIHRGVALATELAILKGNVPF